MIENYARSQGKLMGADPAGLAMAALCTAAAATTDEIKLQPFRFSMSWHESARIWVDLVGDVSSKKTPIISSATAPLAEIDNELFKAFVEAKNAYDRLTKEEKRDGPPAPVSERVMLGDTTVEAVEEALAGSPAGLMVCHDELAGWFGSMERYSGGGKSRASSDRAFWIESYNGDRRASNRITRGVKVIPNCSVCILGGVQPDRIRQIARDAADDGLLQRPLPVILRPGTVARDEQQGDEAKRYKKLIRKLYEIRRPSATTIVNTRLKFSEDAQQVMYRVQSANAKLADTIKLVNQKVAAAFIKGDGTFARLCVLFHCIEHASSHEVPFEISLDIAERVEKFLTEFIQPHQLSFFAGTLGLADDQEALSRIAGLILIKGLTIVTNRIVENAVGSRVKLDNWNVQRLFEQLYSLGWLTSRENRRANDPGTWTVNPLVHTLFEKRKEAEKMRREAAQTVSERLRNLKRRHEDEE